MKDGNLLLGNTIKKTNQDEIYLYLYQKKPKSNNNIKKYNS